MRYDDGFLRIEMINKEDKFPYAIITRAFGFERTMSKQVGEFIIKKLNQNIKHGYDLIDKIL